MARKRRFLLPGFGITLGFTLTYLSLLVLIPLAGLFLRTSALPWDEFVSVAFSPRALAAYRVSFGCALAAALVNVVFGLVVAWVLVRYEFPGKSLIDGLVDLPFALPTAVAGITLTTLLVKTGWIGRWLEPLGIEVAYTPLGITVALVFIGLPFVVRTVQPVLEDVEKELEEAAASLGARRLQTFRRVLFPAITPALATGFTLAFARAIGEYGSVVFISGNMPMRTEIAPFLIVVKLEEFEYAAATGIAVVLLVLSFTLLLGIQGLQALVKRRSAALEAAA